MVARKKCIYFCYVYTAASTSRTPADSSTSAQETAMLKSLQDATPIPSFLHIFASLGGLALIAEHLPIVYHDAPRQASSDDARRDRQSDKWADNVNMVWQLSQAANETWAPMEPVVEEMEVSISIAAQIEYVPSSFPTLSSVNGAFPYRSECSRLSKWMVSECLVICRGFYLLKV